MKFIKRLVICLSLNDLKWSLPRFWRLPSRGVTSPIWIILPCAVYAVDCEVANVEQFSGIWLVDFEFAALSGAAPEVRCLVRLEWYSGQKIRLWSDDIGGLAEPRMLSISILYSSLIMSVLRWVVILPLDGDCLAMFLIYLLSFEI